METSGSNGRQGWWGLVAPLERAVEQTAAVPVVQRVALWALAMEAVATAMAFREEASVAQTAARAVGQHSD